MRALWSRVTRNEPTQDRDHPGITPHPGRALLISIQPRYANAILDGTKTIELRRTTPTLEPGALALIYASTPTKAIIGWATIEDIVEATPTALWRRHRQATGVTATEFNEYFEGTHNAFGLRLTAARRADTHIPLTTLRSHGLQPPQSWRYITAELAQSLRHDMTTPQTSCHTGDTSSKPTRGTPLARVLAAN